MWGGRGGEIKLSTSLDGDMYDGFKWQPTMQIRVPWGGERDGLSRVPWPGVCVLRFKEGRGWVMELLEKNFDMREVEGV